MDSLANMGQVIPQGPTVQPTAPTTNSLADIAAMLLPALVGSQIKRHTPDGVQKGGMLGALQGAGLGAEALETQRVRAQKYQDAQGEAAYRKALTDQAIQSAEHMRIKDEEFLRQISDDKAYEESLTPQQRQEYRNDRAGFLKGERLKMHVPSLVETISVIPAFSKLPKEVIAQWPPELMINVAEKAPQAAAMGAMPEPVEIPLGDGRSATILTYPGTKLKPDVISRPNEGRLDTDVFTEENVVDGKIVKERVGRERTTGKEKWRESAGMIPGASAVVDAMGDVKSLLSEYRRLIPEVLVARGDSGDTAATVKVHGNRLDVIRRRLAADENVKLFDSLQGQLASLARSLGGERGGPLSNQDIERVMKLVPQDFEDSQESAMAKIERMESLLKEKLERHSVGAAEGAKKEASGEIARKIQAARAAGHSDTDIAAYLKSKLGVDPSAYGL